MSGLIAFADFSEAINTQARQKRVEPLARASQGSCVPLLPFTQHLHSSWLSCTSLTTNYTDHLTSPVTTNLRIKIILKGAAMSCRDFMIQAVELWGGFGFFEQGFSV